MFERAADDAGLDRWIDTFLALERAGWKGREGSALACDPRKEALFRAALGGAAAAGRLERLSLMLDGRAIGMLVNFLCPPAAFSFKTAYDERYARYSPGVLLQRENLALLTRDDIAWTDSCGRRRPSDDRAHLAPEAPHGPGQRRDRRGGHAGPLSPRCRWPRAAKSWRRRDDRARADRRRHDACVRWRCPCAASPTPIPKRPSPSATASATTPGSICPHSPGLAAALPAASIEYNRGDLPIGVDGKPAAPAVDRADDPAHRRGRELGGAEEHRGRAAYAALLHALLEELRPAIEARTGAMLRPQGFVFISSPHAVTPYHFDPEHNLLLQLRGTKAMTQFPAGNPRYAPDTVHESYHAGGARELQWDDTLLTGGTEHPLTPGDALHVPVMAPHFVRNGPQPSVSLSITWRSEWSFAEADARGLNRLLRRAGLRPAPPARWPASNRGKALAFRALRRLWVTD